MADISKQNVCRLSVRGMNCPDCASTIEREIRSVSGIEKVNVNFIDQTITLKGQDIDSQQIVDQIRSLGYESEPISLRDEIDTTISQGNSSASSGTRPFLIATSAILIAICALGAKFGWSGLLILSIIISSILIAGLPVIRKGILAARRFRLDINFLMTTAVIGALVIGEWIEAGAIIVLFALAEYLEAKSVVKSRKAIEALVKLTPRTAVVMRDNQEIVVPAEQVKVGDKVLVKPGSVVPVDGSIIAGESYVNQAAITGESMPVLRCPGQELMAGSINGEGALEVLVSRSSGDTTLDRIIQLVKQAQAEHAPVQSFIERFAAYYTPVVVSLALLIAVIPPLFLGGAWFTWIYRALALLVIACPCALVISTPITIVSALTGAARRGVLIKGGVYLENLYRIRSVCLDKTGTVTSGVLRIRDVYPFNGSTRREVLSLSASVESYSQHPIARTITEHARNENVEFASPVNFSSITGKGAHAEVLNQTIYIGTHGLFEELKICDGSVHGLLADIENDNQTAVMVGTKSKIIGIIVVADEVRDGVKESIGELRQAGVNNISLLTGDNHRTGEAVARAIGADEARAELLPEDKVSEIKRLRGRYGSVAMVGDGVNDAPALAAADIGIAMGNAGTDVTLETSDVVILADKLHRLPWIMRLSRKTRSIIVQNISFAIGVKLLFITLASVGQATLWMAVFADMGVSLLVIFNGLRALHTK